MAHVHIQRSHASFTDGEREFIVDADTVGAIITQLNERYPGLGPLLRHGSSVAINSAIIANGEFERVGSNTSVHFIAKVTGG